MTALTLSANTGFLWKDRPFLERLHAAAANGFTHVEFHDEAQREDPDALQRALDETGLKVVGLNTRMGDTAGCAAVPDSITQARADIDDAIRVAKLVNAKAIHVVAGKTPVTPESMQTIADNLAYAIDNTDHILLLEPLCSAKMPGYFVQSLTTALEVIERVGSNQLRVMFDCFHIETEHGNTQVLFEQHVDKIGHVQIASVPERVEPVAGQIDYSQLLPAFQAAGYTGAIGCEYTPVADTAAGLGWRDQLDWV